MPREAAASLISVAYLHVKKRLVFCRGGCGSIGFTSMWATLFFSFFFSFFSGLVTVVYMEGGKPNPLYIQYILKRN